MSDDRDETPEPPELLQPSQGRLGNLEHHMTSVSLVRLVGNQGSRPMKIPERIIVEKTATLIPC